MEEILQYNGFMQTENPNEWIRGNWTIRFEGDFMEIFNDPDKEIGKYFIGPAHKYKLRTILQEIQ